MLSKYDLFFSMSALSFAIHSFALSSIIIKMSKLNFFLFMISAIMWGILLTILFNKFTITKIEYRENKSSEDKAIDKLTEVFNKEAEKQDLKFRIEKINGYPSLVEPLFWCLGNTLGDNQIFWNENEDEYSFIGGILPELFEEIKLILEKIELKFKIELIR